MFNTPQTITLTGGQLELTDTTGPTTITGPAAGLLTVSGNGPSRVFQVDGGVTASISGLTITGGNAAGNGGGLCNNGGTLTLTDCTVSGNSASGSGGGLFNVGGTATLTDCTVSGNSASARRRRPVQLRRHGHADQLHRQRQLRRRTAAACSTRRHGHADQLHRQRQLRRTPAAALYNIDGTATLTNCTVSGNSAGSSGGGLFNVDGTTTLTDCTVSGNSATAAAAAWIDIGGTTTLTNCTVSGNSAGTSGGGVLNACVRHDHADQLHRQRQLRHIGGGGLTNHGGTATLTDCTVSGNTAGNNGGGTHNLGGTITLTNCTVSSNLSSRCACGVCPI